MTFAAPGPRVLLRRLRAVMAEQEPAQQKLDRIVQLIAANMVAEVCSLYVLVDEDTLELFATEGLNPQAVHRVRLAVGEGLVGVIAATAEPLNLSQAQKHPAFHYLPETGEEIYQSFLGVPILRGGAVSGVLVVQNRQPRRYSEEEREALEIIAMVLAEFLASPEVLALREALGAGRLRSHHLHGEGLHPGIAIGEAVLHESRIPIRRFEASDPQAERDRLHEALGGLRAELERLRRHPGLAGSGHDAILETMSMFAADAGWIRRMEDYIRLGLTADAAVARVQSDNRARMLRQPDPYLRARLHDLDDLSWRLLRILARGQDGVAEPQAAHRPLPENAILFARSMGPAELLEYDHRRLAGLVLEEGARLAHVTLVARALGVPLVAGVEGATDYVENGDAVIIDGRSGEVHIRPQADLLDSYRNRLALREDVRRRFTRLKDEPAVSRDGVRFDLLINAGLPSDLEHLHTLGADGIGLFRTEMDFLMRRRLPRRGEQEALYRSVLETAGEKPVLFRTLDIGADKVPLFMTNAREPNPAMGWRAIRIGLDRPGLLKLQLRALLAAAEGRTLHVMFPMVADTAELRAARSLLEEQVRLFTRMRRPLPERVLVGVMLEVPALLWQLSTLLGEADFISIGTNDLMQFVFAADRANPRTARRYDPLHPAMVRLLREVAAVAGGRGGVRVSVCGDMAGDPLEAMVLAGLGFTRLSMPPAGIGPVKAMIRSLDVGRLRGELHRWLAEAGGACSLREPAARFARAHGVDILRA